MWKIQGSKYLVASVWEEIRPRKVRKEWHKLVWTSLSIQKHAVITWMVVLDRLPTLVRMASWGIEVNSLCKLCQNGDETRDHLFFQCSYSNEVWRTILQLCGLNRSIMTWFDELVWAVKRMKGRALLSIVMRLAWRASIYYIWRERNRKMHGHISKNTD